MILVVGGTGTTGREVVSRLLAAGEQFRVMVRSPEKVENLKASGVDVMQGDLENPASFSAVLQGVAKVFLLSAADPRQSELQGKFIGAAKAAGVRYIVRMSALGANPNAPIALAKWHGETDQRLQASGVPFTILRPHYFMQNLLMMAPTIVGESKFYAPMQDGKISLVDVRDIAAVAVKVLLNDGHEGKIYDITGPESLSFHDIADAIGKATGKSVQYVNIAAEEAQRGMVSAGVPEWLADALVALYGVFAAGHAAAITQTVMQVTGQSARPFMQFAEEFAQVFGKAEPVQR